MAVIPGSASLWRDGTSGQTIDDTRLMGARHVGTGHCRDHHNGVHRETTIQELAFEHTRLKTVLFMSLVFIDWIDHHWRITHSAFWHRKTGHELYDDP